MSMVKCLSGSMSDDERQSLEDFSDISITCAHARTTPGGADEAAAGVLELNPTVTESVVIQGKHRLHG
jgi:hypothetical protein